MRNCIRSHSRVFETGSRWSMAVSAGSTNGRSGFSRPTRGGRWRSRRARPTDGRVYRDRLPLVDGDLDQLDQRSAAGFSRPAPVGRWRSRRARPTDCQVSRDRLASVHGDLGGLDQRMVEFIETDSRWSMAVSAGSTNDKGQASTNEECDARCGQASGTSEGSTASTSTTIAVTLSRPPFSRAASTIAETASAASFFSSRK